jgi:hypothetical protein
VTPLKIWDHIVWKRKAGSPYVLADQTIWNAVMKGANVAFPLAKIERSQISRIK